MNRETRWLVCVAIFILTALSAAAQDRVWTATGEVVEGWEHIDGDIQDFMEFWGIRGASLAAAYEGRLVFARGYTWDSPEVEPIQPTSLFRIASMSKPITSVAIHQLVERGLLSLDARVVDILDLEPAPGMTADPWLEEVTVDHLLYHLGGWDRGLAYDPMFRDEIIAAALDVDLPISKCDIATYMTGQLMQHRPGTRYAYSNYGYALLGMIIEEVTGRDYSEWVAENVFAPIGVGRPRRGHTVLAELAPGEVRYYGASGQDPYRWNIENMDAHGGWILSAPDYLRLMGAVFDDRDSSPLLSRASIESMIETHPATAAADYGRGWVVFRDGDLEIIGHNGGLDGTITTARWTANDLSVVALLNTSGNFGDFDPPGPTSVPSHDLFESVGIVQSAVGAALAESWIPVVANGDGSGGSVWRSDVGLLNRSTLANQVRLSIELPDLNAEHEVQLAPGEHLTVNDVVSELGLDGTGSLRVYSSEPLTISSRTYNVSSDGTFGQFLGGVTGPGGLRKGQSAVLMHLREDDGARSNIGILNAGRREAQVEIQLFDGTGEEIVSLTRRVDPGEVRQLNRPIANLGGRTDVAAGYALIRVLEGEDVVVYGSVVDAGTNDPTTIPMKRGLGASTSWVAAAARADGTAGSVWRTDLGLLNLGATAVDVTVIFRRTGGGVVEESLALESGEHRVLEDVVGWLGAEGSGSLEVTASGAVQVGSRTYNTSESGTFGQFLDGVPASATVAVGSRVWLPQLQQNDDFRTNIGFHNTGADDARIRLHLHDGDGTLLSTNQRVITAGGLLQIQEPFDRFSGRADITSGYAVVEIVNGGGLVAYASVIDNRTNDPTTVPMAQ
jgi:CubicO group peptidase (beta-lactamase class C family)